MAETTPLSEKIESKAKALWLHQSVPWVINGSVAVCCFWFWLYPPEIGVAVTVLAAVLGIMAFREMPYSHRIAGAVLVIGLMGLEIHDIQKDTRQHEAEAKVERNLHDREVAQQRADEDKRFEQARREEDDRFAQLLKSQGDSFNKVLSLNQGAFNKTMGQLTNLGAAAKSLGTIAQESLDRISERESILYPVSLPSPPSHCQDMPRRSGDLVIIAGTSEYVAGRFPQDIVSINGFPLLSVDKAENGGIALSFQLFDGAGDIIAYSSRNSFWIRSDTRIEKPDKGHIIVYDRQ